MAKHWVDAGLGLGGPHSVAAWSTLKSSIQFLYVNKERIEIVRSVHMAKGPNMKRPWLMYKYLETSMAQTKADSALTRVEGRGERV